jgi:hypothetical protein
MVAGFAGKPETIWHFDYQTGVLPSKEYSKWLDLQRGGLQIRMVAGFADAAEGKEVLVAGARYVPNRQFLNIPFRSELVHYTVWASHCDEDSEIVSGWLTTHEVGGNV